MKRISYFLLLLVVLPGCNVSLFDQTITDKYTEPNVERIEIITDNMLIYEHMNDNMSRGYAEYYANPVVIDLEYYGDNQLSRGDVVYYRFPHGYEHENIYGEPMSISRVVGLPNETIEIISSQIYINDKLLDTFYGQQHWRGLNKEHYKELLNNGSQAEHIPRFLESMESFNREKLEIPEGYVYIIDDTWGRSFDSNTFGPIPIENIHGKVLGYNK